MLRSKIYSIDVKPPQQLKVNRNTRETEHLTKNISRWNNSQLWRIRTNSKTHFTNAIYTLSNIAKQLANQKSSSLVEKKTVHQRHRPCFGWRSSKSSLLWMPWRFFPIRMLIANHSSKSICTLPAMLKTKQSSTAVKTTTQIYFIVSVCKRATICSCQGFWSFAYICGGQVCQRLLHLSVVFNCMQA